MKEGDAWLRQWVSPSFLFAAGLALAPALWLQTRVPLKAGQAVFFFTLAAVFARAGAAEAIRSAAASLIFLAATVLFNLAAPLGRVLFQVGAFPVTAEALATGLRKGLTLVGLVYLSRSFVRRGLALPGAAGRYLGRTFHYLNGLLARRAALLRLRPANLDEVFSAVFAEEPRPAPAAPAAKSRARRVAGAAVLAALLAGHYGLLFLSWP
jgi:hypothetical protein